MAKRFRVALSLPGEHLARVEKIAETLAAALGRDFGRVYRGTEGYLWRKLGAFGADLSLLANFFETP